MTMQTFVVHYKTDTNKHHPGDPRAYDTRERRIVTSSSQSAIDYVLRTTKPSDRLVPGTAQVVNVQEYRQ